MGAPEDTFDTFAISFLSETNFYYCTTAARIDENDEEYFYALTLSHEGTVLARSQSTGTGYLSLQANFPKLLGDYTVSFTVQDNPNKPGEVTILKSNKYTFNPEVMTKHRILWPDTVSS